MERDTDRPVVNIVPNTATVAVTLLACAHRRHAARAAELHLRAAGLWGGAWQARAFLTGTCADCARNRGHAA